VGVCYCGSVMVGMLCANIQLKLVAFVLYTALSVHSLN